MKRPEHGYGTSDLFFHSRRFEEGLSKIPREGWVKRGVQNPESVAEHVESMAQLAVAFYRETSLDIDILYLHDIIQVHDLAELRTGDLVAVDTDPEILADKKRAKREKELRAMVAICNEIGTAGGRVLRLWMDYEGGTTLEARIAKQIDKIQVMRQAWLYEQAGHEGVSAQEFLTYAPDADLIVDPTIRGWYDALVEEVKAAGKWQE